VFAHRLGAARDLVGRLAFRAQRDEEAADLSRSRFTAHDRGHHFARLRASQTRAFEETGQRLLDHGRDRLSARQRRRLGGADHHDVRALPVRPSEMSGRHAWATTASLSERSVHRYGDDRSQLGELFLPNRADGVPVAVVLHGGFWRDAYDRSLMDGICEDLAGSGWAAWNLEYRRLGAGGGWPETFLDVAAGIDELLRLAGRELDLGIVVTIGHSAGGHLALWAAARRCLPPEAPGSGPRVLVTHAIAQSGVVDLVEAARLRLSRGAAEELLRAPPQEAPERYLLASPAERLPLGVPQLLVHGERDDIVPPEMSRVYARDARAAGDPVDLAMHQDLGHFEHLDPTSPAWRSVRDWLPL
jgi:acetyl esterase/lipase